MISKKLSIVLMAVFTANLLLNANVFAKDVSGTENFKDLNVVVDGQKLAPKTEVPKMRRNVKSADAKVVANPDSCAFNYPDTESYGAEVLAIRRRLKVDPGETFRVKVFFKNTGNMPWFSERNLACHGLKMYLNTARTDDHASVFYKAGLQGWESPSRIAMDQLRVDPGQIASFTFMAQAGGRDDVYKEYFVPVLKDVQRLNDSQFYLDVMIGDTGGNAGDLRKQIAYATSSGSVMDVDLSAPKKLQVHLASQTLSVYLGNNDVRDFRVSTGKYDTPTPTGHYSIILKQEERVGNEPPHYVMPKYMMFQSSGYGFHALPSLAHDGNTFWTEAFNHIGIPVSHGCVRLLPQDATWLFDFTDVGTNVEILDS